MLTIYTVYPNPTSGGQILAIELNNSSNVEIGLYDITGKRVKDVYRGSMATGLNKINVGLGALPHGMYIYHLQINDESHHIKVIKQ